MEIGLFLPVMLEESLPNLKKIDWTREKKTVLAAEEYGFESVAIPDHLQIGDGPNFEQFSVLSALAEVTDEMKLLTMVTCVPFRNPALVSKMSATIDVISNGRFQLGIGAGWHKPEFEAYGFDFEDAKTRVDRLEESAQIIRKTWEQEETTFDGEFYQLDGCICKPKPVEPYLVVGGKGKRVQQIAERYADEWNFSGSYKDMLERSPEIENVKVSWFGPAIVSRDENHLERMAEEAYPDRPSRYISGTPEEFLGKLENLENKGVDRAIFRLIDYPKNDSLDLLRDEVIPEL